MQRLKNLYFGLLYVLPAFLFCAYYPIISLGGNASMNFELSLPLIWLVVFDLVGLILLVRIGIRKKSVVKRKDSKIKWWKFDFAGITDRKIFLLSLFPFWLTLSIFWSENTIRAILTAGIVWLLFFAIFTIAQITPILGVDKNFRRKILWAIFIPTIIICIFCIWQSFADALGMNRDQTLMCLGCTSIQFGFPHPNGLAIEPQFMGNLLLAPTLLGLYLISIKINNRQKKEWEKEKILVIVSTVLSCLTLFITFSRGAIYAFGVAWVLLVIISRVKSQTMQLAPIITIPVIIFLGSLGLQGIWAEVGPTNETFVSAVTKSVHQLSLGRIDLRIQKQSDNNTTQTNAVESETLIENVDEENNSSSSNFDGYVAESTNIRLDLNKVAINTWTRDWRTILLGVGIGGAGIAMHENSPELITTSKEIVQNQYVSILLELGIVGILLILVAVFAVIPRIIDVSKKHSIWLIIIIAYLLTLNFFAGLPNALHIYLIPPLLLLLLDYDLLKLKTRV